VLVKCRPAACGAVRGLEPGLRALADDTGQGQNTLAALRRRFERMRNYGFLRPKALDDSVGRIMKHLESGNHVVLEFGRYGSDRAQQRQQGDQKKQAFHR
jgi:hypothetical protein